MKLKINYTLYNKYSTNKEERNFLYSSKELNIIFKPGGPKHLWSFLLELLREEKHQEYIKWIDQDVGVFKIVNSKAVSQLWGMRKNNPKMNFDTLSRSLRNYYKQGIISHVDGHRLMYQFNYTPIYR